MEQLDDPTFKPLRGAAARAAGYACVRYALSGIPGFGTATVKEITDLKLHYLSDIERSGIYPQGWNALKIGDHDFRLRLNDRYRMRYRMVGSQILEVEIFYVGIDARRIVETSA